MAPEFEDDYAASTASNHKISCFHAFIGQGLRAVVPANGAYVTVFSGRCCNSFRLINLSSLFARCRKVTVILPNKLQVRSVSRRFWDGDARSTCATSNHGQSAAALAAWRSTREPRNDLNDVFPLLRFPWNASHGHCFSGSEDKKNVKKQFKMFLLAWTSMSTGVWQQKKTAQISLDLRVAYQRRGGAPDLQELELEEQKESEV